MLDHVLPAHLQDALTPRHLRLIVFPTEKCNLRCTYCYEDFAQGRIKPAVISGIKALISKRASDLNLLELSWFGGEPLLAASDILDICNHAASESRKNRSLAFISSMTTNGTLLSAELAEALVTAGVKTYQISLDGLKQQHDVSRTTVTGNGTFDVIWKRLLDLADTRLDFTVTLRVHYTNENWLLLLPLIDEINNNFGHDPRFKVFFKSIVRMGGKNDHNITRITQQDNILILEELYGRLRDREMKTAEWVKDDYVCYAAKANSFVVRSNGAINKCTVALNDNRNAIGYLNSDGSMNLDRSKMMPWLRGIESQNAFELACPFTSHIKAM